MNDQTNIAPYSNAIILLLKGVLYDESRRAWSELFNYSTQISHYFEQIGIEVMVNEKEGYAYLRQRTEEETGVALPRLVTMRALSYEVTLLCVLLRQWLEEFDASNTDTRNLFISNQQIKDNIEVFFKETSNVSQLLAKFDAIIERVRDLGFLELMQEDKADKRNNLYKVKRIIKAQVNNEDLERLKQKIANDVGIIHEQ